MIIKGSISNTDEINVISVSKKHWSSYFFLYLSIIIGTILLLTFFTEYWYLSIPGALFIIIAFFKILARKTVQWILTDEEVIIKAGFLPWKKRYEEIPVEQIYEAYYHHGFFANLLGYGNLTLRQTDGTTSIKKFYTMSNPKDITFKINSLKKEKLKQLNSGVVNHNKILNVYQPLSVELDKLLALKEQGVLSELEFEQQKIKLLNQ